MIVIDFDLKVKVRVLNGGLRQDSHLGIALKSLFLSFPLTVFFPACFDRVSHACNACSNTEPPL